MNCIPIYGNICLILQPRINYIEKIMKQTTFKLICLMIALSATMSAQAQDCCKEGNPYKIHSKPAFRDAGSKSTRYS